MNAFIHTFLASNDAHNSISSRSPITFSGLTLQSLTFWTQSLGHFCFHLIMAYSDIPINRKGLQIYVFKFIDFLPVRRYENLIELI
jgi:hypothetical protein